MTTVQLSIIVPVHDVGPWIREQLDCILRQDVDLEVIVIDDHSGDDTVAVVQEMAAQDGRVRLHHAASVGGGAARNEGLDLARGEYVAFADGDDLVPDGAYRTLIRALESTDAEMAIGRHLKFSSGATWEPMATWYDVTSAAVTNLDGMPALLANRACWNRVFRSGFLRASGVRFPDAARSNDVVPMVCALVAAERIAVVPSIVYLYRQRPGASSMTARASGVEGTLSYIVQESAAALLLAGSEPEVRRAHARVVLDADGYVHLARFLRECPSEQDVARVVEAVRGLLAELPLIDREAVRAERRALWYLVAEGAADLAVQFAVATQEDPTADGVRLASLRAWAATIAWRGGPAATSVFELDRDALLDEGPLVLLANRAEHTDSCTLEKAISDLAPLMTVTRTRSEVLRAVAQAVQNGDALGVRMVSAVRHLAPFVVDVASPDAAGLTMEGPLRSDPLDGVRLEIAMTSDDGTEFVSAIEHDDARWRSRVHTEDLAPGRHRVALVVSFRDLELRLPVVTARMPLPPVGDGVQLQPLADRADGWRVLVDRRAAPHLLRRFARAARSRLRGRR
ncbi:glycosyltransferase family 2 protein [Curtobacterium pusillum]|uniref:glycosyltransferase family 2 protein n=1 Tax=Curtobacterium pusillum TaxID=69373 RepID=UPI0011A9EDB8|nr:glycosyltransferase family 2 protein [Curtobacterium pusillum]